MTLSQTEFSKTVLIYLMRDLRGATLSCTPCNDTVPSYELRTHVFNHCTPQSIACLCGEQHTRRTIGDDTRFFKHLYQCLMPSKSFSAKLTMKRPNWPTPNDSYFLVTS